MSTLESVSSHEGDSNSKGESEFEDDSNSEYDSDSEGEYDPKGDSDGGSDFEGDPTSKGGTSEGGSTSECEVAQFQRPQRLRQIPRRLVDFELLQDTEIDSEGEVIHSAMIVDFEPVSINEALKKKVWVNTMKEELEAIERNKTW